MSLFRRPGPDPSSAAFFEKKYRQNSDPWNFTQSDYEQGRYERIMAALAGRRYGNAFEPGCSVGALTEKLITLCDHVEAIDFAESAITAARARCPHPQITFRVMGLPERLPLQGFDLIVLSEIGYYFTGPQWTAIAGAIVADAPVGTTILCAHWLGFSPDHRLSGDDVHAVLRSQPALHLSHEERHPGFRLDRWERVANVGRST